MALKLLLKSNDIKEYATVSEAGGGEGGPTTYSTKCGLIQDCSARPTEECDHLDCAIDVTIQAYNRSIEIDPEDADVCYNKGMALRLLGRNTKADATLAHAKKKLNSKGNDLFDLEKYAEAIKAYDIALAADPKYMNAWINKGTAFFRLDRYDEAIAVFNQITEIDPQHADAWHRKGVVLKKMGRKVEAGDAFVRAKELGYKR